MQHLAQAAYHLSPADGPLNAFADALRDRIAGMTGHAAVDPPASLVSSSGRGAG